MSEVYDKSERTIGWIDMSKILCDKTFNVRHESHIRFQEHVDDDDAWEDPEGREMSNGIASLAESIVASGQTTPIIVRTNPDVRTKEKWPLMIVAGHCRYAAFELICARARSKRDDNPLKKHYPNWSIKNPQIFAEVQALDESEALLLNMTENTARAQLTAADFAYGVYRLSREYKRETRKEKGAAVYIASATGMSHKYIRTLLIIMENVAPQDLEHWRSSKMPLSVTTMHLIATSEGDRRELYKKYCSGAKPRVESGPPSQVSAKPQESDDTRAVAALRAVSEFCEIMGGLASDGFLDATGCADFQDRAILARITRIPNDGMLGQLAQTARDAFERGRTIAR